MDISARNRETSDSHPRIRVGIGGWTFEPWRGNFYPAGLAHSKELQYASRQLTAIEVNGTYYSSFKPPTFAKWRDETPEGFSFSLKANRFATHRRVLAVLKYLNRDSGNYTKTNDSSTPTVTATPT